jgi:hypothetical protein
LKYKEDEHRIKERELKFDIRALKVQVPKFEIFPQSLAQRTRSQSK